MAETKIITKQLAGIEDILTGIGAVNQQRSTGIKTIKKLNPSEIQGAIVVDTITDMQALDISLLGDTKTVIVNDAGVFVYDSTKSTISNNLTIFNGWVLTSELELDSVSELIDITDSDNGRVCIVKDIDRGGVFVYDSTKVASDNQGTNFNGWIRQFDSNIKPEWFGAKGDGITDDTTALNNTFQHTSEGQTVQLDGTYMVLNSDVSKLIQHTNTTFFPWNSGGILPAVLIEGKNNISIIGKGSIEALENTDGTYLNTLMCFRNCNNVDITGLTFNGHDELWISGTPSNIWDLGIAIVGDLDYIAGSRLSDYNIDKCKLLNIHSGSIFMYMVDNVSVTNNLYSTARGVANDVMFVNNLTLNSNLADGVYEFCDLDKYVYNATISNNNLVHSNNAGGDAMIELNGSRHITISGNTIDGNGQSQTGILISAKKSFGDQVVPVVDSQVQDVVVSDNKVKNCARGIYVANYNVGEADDYEYDFVRGIITNNIVTDCYDSTYAAYRLAGIDINVIDNIAKSNDGNGIDSNAPGFKNSNIKNNNIISTGNSGMYLSHKSIYSQIVGNVIKFSNKNAGAAGSYYGIFISEAEDANISDNLVKENAVTVAMRVQGYDNTVSYGKVTGNVINGGDIKFTGDIINNAVLLNNSGTIVDFDTNQNPANVFYGSSVPTSGTYTQGDICFNSSVTSAGPLGWVCTGSGTPGTWKEMGIVNKTLADLYLTGSAVNTLSMPNAISIHIPSMATDPANVGVGDLYSDAGTIKIKS